VVVLELPRPLALRRLVSLAEAIYSGQIQIEDIRGQRVEDPASVEEALRRGDVPVLADPEAEARHWLRPAALVDGRMRKQPPELGLAAAFVVGLGPGLNAGVDCHEVVETRRGHHMGQVIWNGRAEADSGQPEAVVGVAGERLLRAPAAGELAGSRPLGSLVRRGEEVARVGREPVLAPFDGALRGLMHDGLEVRQGDKIGDLDPRREPAYCLEISDKSLAVGGGVLEALLSQTAIRRLLGE
jgi:xanthine dehydrogenase accessory factor